MKKLIALLLALLLAAPALAAMAEPVEWTCPDCGSLNAGNFCTECGAKRPEEIACPDCGAVYPIDTDYRFCMECGAKLTAGEAEPQGVDPKQGRFAAPEDAVLRYVGGLKARDLDMMLSAFDWETLAGHATLENYLAYLQSYSPASVPLFPNDDGMMSSVNAGLMKAGVVRLVCYSLLDFATIDSEDGNTPRAAAQGYSVTVKPENQADFVARFDAERVNSLARIADVQLLAPEVVYPKYLSENTAKIIERNRVRYGADELREYAVTFTIDGETFVFFPLCARYGETWTMVSPGGILSAMLGVDSYHQAFMSVDALQIGG